MILVLVKHADVFDLDLSDGAETLIFVAKSLIGRSSGQTGLRIAWTDTID